MCRREKKREREGNDAVQINELEEGVKNVGTTGKGRERVLYIRE